MLKDIKVLGIYPISKLINKIAICHEFMMRVSYAMYNLNEKFESLETPYLILLFDNIVYFQTIFILIIHNSLIISGYFLINKIIYSCSNIKF